VKFSQNEYGVNLRDQRTSNSGGQGGSKTGLLLVCLFMWPI
jgi:hypothetical protein